MRRYLWLLVLAALGLSGWVEFRHARRPLAQEAVLLVLAPAEGWTNLTAAQRRGLGLLFQDCLEYGTGLVVVEESQTVARPANALTVQVRRDGDRAWMTLRLQRPGRKELLAETSGDRPIQTLREGLRWLGLEARAADALLPQDPALFWDLAALAAGRQGTPFPDALAACGRILDREPRCAGAWLTQGRLLNVQNNEDSQVTPEGQDQCEKAFLMAMALVPECPRAAADLGRFRTDAGNHRAALDLLFGAIQRNPRAPRLYEATAYAARGAGLLEGASLALDRRDALLGLSRGEPGLAENTYLYRGDLDRFELVLGPSGPQEDLLRDFYRGYARLLRGDRAGAEVCFAKACGPGEGPRQFKVLAEAYLLELQGQREAGLAKLRQLWAERVPVRAPDGEFTFKVAEAFGYLGCPAEAQDVANRAFAQGFACTRWYEQSPFLAGLRGTPRWNALEQHLKERQVLIEATYPRERFSF